MPVVSFLCYFCSIEPYHRMKKNLLLPLIAIAVFLNSCKKDNNNSPQTNQTDNSKLITGKWYWVEQNYQSYTNDQLTDTRDYTTVLDPQSYFEFDSDGTFIENPQDHNGQFKYGKYQLKGDSLFFSDAGVNYQWQIKKLTSSSLVIHETTGEAPYRGEVTYSMKK